VINRWFKKQPVFVCGMGRSGTTWLARSLALSPELFYIHEAWLVEKLHELSDWYRKIHKEYSAFTPWHDIDRDQEMFRRKLSCFYRDLLETASGGRRVLEKTPSWNVEHLKFLNELFPDAYFVLVYRDGRNYAASLEQKRINERITFHFDEACARWAFGMDVFREVSEQKLIKNCKIVRYEEIDIEDAEVDGFPRTTCGWIKGMYAACLDHGIGTIIAVTQGDCSNTHVLMEIFRMRGVATIPFGFPFGRDRALMERSLRLLRERFGVGGAAAETWRGRLNRIRAKLHEIDRMTWRDDTVTGFENHLLLVSSSDFESDPDAFEAKLDRFIAEASAREPLRHPVRLGFIGVPPIIEGLYQYAESHGARVVFNETQRQFAMPFGGGTLADQYLRYTYPYDIGPRIGDIGEQIARRGIDGIIHYVQSFCHRQMEDLIFRERLDRPILTVEGDAPREIDARTKIRLESFIGMIAERKGAHA